MSAIYITSFDKIKDYKFPDNIIPISIVQSPFWYKGLEYEGFLPPYGYRMEYKEYSMEQQVKRYKRRVLDKLDFSCVTRDLLYLIPESKWHKAKVCLIVNDQTGEFSFRNTIIKWYADNGWELEEYDFTQNTNSETNKTTESISDTDAWRVIAERIRSIKGVH